MNIVSVKMQFIPSTGRVLKRGRCDECKRRKKRCVGDGPICDFCKKKGLSCNNYDALQIVQFEGPQRKKQKESPQLEVDTKGKQDEDRVAENSKAFPHKDSSGISMDYHKLTPSALVNLVKENLPKNGNGSSYLNFDGLAVDNAPTIYLPRKKWVKDSDQPPILQDETTIKIFDKETTIPKEFSLIDFLLSSTRVNLVDLATCHLEEPVSFEEIDGFLKASKSKRTIDTLKEHGYLVASKTSNLRGSSYTPQSPNASVWTPSSRTKTTSIDDIEFVIDLENLKSHYYVQKAAIAIENPEDATKKFSNLPDFIDPVFANELFQRFCAISQDANYTGDLALTSFAAFEGSSGMDKDSVKINFLKVCLPLIFGNVTVLKCVLVLSYYHWRNTEPENEFLKSKDRIIKELHICALEDLQERVQNCFSLCCDHSLLAVVLLMSTEVINGLKGKLCVKLLKFVRSMIVLRGGVSKLAENLTGLCLMKLLSVHFAAGGLCSFQSNIGNDNSNDFDNASDSISLVNFFNILDSHPQLDFYDNLNFYSKLGLNDTKGIVRIYGHITQMYNLSTVSYDANNSSVVTDPSLKLYGDYDSVSLTNLEFVLQESERIEKLISETSKNSNWDHLIIPFHHKLQSTFAQKASLLYLYQTVYRQTSLSPKTILLVKSLLKDVEQLFGELKFLSPEESQKSVLFILPLFVLGVDLISTHKRSWFKDELMNLYSLTKKEPLRTCVEMLEKVWEMNSTGTMFVDWRMLSYKYSMFICLCV